MEKINLRAPYKLSELIKIVASAIVTNGVGNNLSYEDTNFYLYTRKEEELASSELICYADDYPSITEEGEEVYPEFVIKEGLKVFFSGDRFEDVISNILHQKSQPSMDDFLAGLNCYMGTDSFSIYRLFLRNAGELNMSWLHWLSEKLFIG